MLEKAYDPKPIEEKWYRLALEKGLFRADPEAGGEPFCIVIPPPNVTGSLHMGHALNSTLQDILIRYKRMDGFNALWVPGTDHAGIATQNVVEKQLAQEGKSRTDLGREKFVERVWQWKEQYGGIIIDQLKRMGASCDWSRLRFTMDEGLSKAVREVFVRLYEDGLIYRGHYIINWCPRCQTALSDLEVDLTETEGHLWHIRYPMAGAQAGAGAAAGGISVATTRPETMLGDTAVAVHPDDARYAALRGRKVLLPLLEREIPVIADLYVDPEFGSGAVKITPAHDFNDFEVGRRHGLEVLQVMDGRAVMNERAGRYQGLTREECRKRVVEDLERQGLLESIEPYKHNIGHCYRCRTIVEPYLSLQWFVRMKPLAEPAIEAVRDGRVRIHPCTWESTYFEWMNNIRDWCISRQIWWGHRIPAWTCKDCGEVTVSRTDPDRCRACGGAAIEQESDVLDTWFSSGLWPFSTLGWPDRTRDLEVYYPTSVMVTGFDILFFWVARMIMMGLRCMGDVPFRDVYIHALVRDAEGQKMSKSKGNVIDPLVIVDRYGADSFRYTLAALAAQGRDIRMSEDRIKGYRFFMNKIWNAVRFIRMNLEGWDPPPAAAEAPEPSLLDRWILSRLADTIRRVREALDACKFNEAAHYLYQFIWHEFCDWYLELTKVDLAGGDPRSALRVRFYLHRAMTVLLKLLHPFAPFVSDELWSHLPATAGTLPRAPFPRPEDGTPDPQAEQEAGLVLQVITGIRNVRGELNVPPAEQLSVSIVCPDAGKRALIEALSPYVRFLARLRELEVAAAGSRPPQSAVSVLEDVEIYVRLGGILNFEEEMKRLDKTRDKLGGELDKIARKLASAQFVERAPREIVDKERERQQALLEEERRLLRNMEQLREIAGEGSAT
ncbi:MAG: valine--tRNA ligase [bacterium]